MRVLIVNKFARVTGGADRHCLELAALLRNRGHRVAFLSTYHTDNVETAGIFVPCTVVGEKKHGLPLGRQATIAATAVWSRAAAHAMRELVKEFRPDVVHAHKLYPQLSVSPLAIARSSGVPVVQTVHDYEFLSASPWDHTGAWIDRDERGAGARVLNSVLFLEKRSIHRRFVTTWIAVSGYVERSLAEGGIASIALPNFVMGGTASPSLERRSGLVFVGRLSREKGIEHVLQLAESMPRTVVRVAGDGPFRPQVLDAATRHRSIEYLGRLKAEDVKAALRSARVALVPSLWQEPGALSVLEAMAAGTPVVAYDVGGIAEYVRDAGAGIVVPPDARALVAACSRLIDDDALWSRLSRRAIAAASTTHDPNAYCATLETIYRDTIDGIHSKICR